MDVVRFALAYRFDRLGSEDDRTQKDRALSLFIARIEPALLEGMSLHAGRYMLGENDDPDILTVVTMGKGLKATKKLWKAVESDPILMSALTGFRPIIQSNNVFRMEDFESYGVFGADGTLSGGTTEFGPIPVPKELYDECYPIKIVVAPDKFKGTFDQFEAAKLIRDAAKKALPGCRVIEAPVADGGDGTAGVLAKLTGGRRRKVVVTGPDRQPTEAEYCFIDNETAVIEMAQASGLALVRGELDPLHATSRGTGELIADALKNGAKKLLIGIGGSATNDGGMGAAAALGARFLDEAGNELEGCGADMENVRRIDLSGLDPSLGAAELIVLSDVNNPLTGPDGATAVYGPQKGAIGEVGERLENGMRNIEALYNGLAGREVCSEPGAGAAGGMGAMLKTLLNARLVSGAETVLSQMDFDRLIRDAALVVTGEGRLDASSIDSGKAVGAVIRRAKEAGANIMVIAGCFGQGYEKVFEHANAGLFSTVTGAADPAETDAERLERTAERAFRALRGFIGGAEKLIKQ